MIFLLGIRILADVFVSSYWFGFGVILLTSCIRTGEMKAPVVTLCSLPIALGLFYLGRLVVNLCVNKKKIKHNLFLGLISLVLVIIYFVYIFVDPDTMYMNRTLIIFTFIQMFFGSIEINNGDDKNEKN